jgi:hypothetical protein
VRQETLTVVARVAEGPPHPALRSALQAFARDAFADPRLGIHFARLVLLAEPSTAEYGSSLVFEANFDTHIADVKAARVAHLELLCTRLGDPLRSVFQHCARFSASSSDAELAALLVKRLVPATAAYQGHAARDLRRIRLEQRLRDVLLDFFSSAAKAPPRELYHAAREHVRLLCLADPLLAGLDLDQPAPAVPDAALRSERLNAGLWAWFRNLSWSLVGFALGQLHHILSWQRTDPEFDQRGQQEAWSPADFEMFTEIAGTEDHALQNALTHVVSLKNADRLAVLTRSHAYIDVMAKQHFNDIGQLGGIPTIHFAKWLLLDNDTRLLFLSNYDSSWESYLGDFVDRAAIGLNLAWTCTEGYPRTALLALKGASDEERFKAWSRAHQRPTQVFYTAYPELGIAALNNNSWIRCGLHHPPGAADLAGWFRRLT